MSNCIVRAEREVYLATNYWQNGVASKFLTDAIRELSRRAGEKGTKIVMKIIYDRGSPKQVFEPHYLVSEKAYTGKAVNLPHPSEIPNIDMEVVNYHQPMLGTFHAKYMVVDRKIAILQSNNIQDNDNVEMMVHLEGPIVDSMYDMALISWHMRMSPPLPTLDTPAAQAGGNPSETLNDDVGRIPTGHGSSESGQDRTLDSVSNVPIANEALAGFLSVGESPVPQPPSENTIPEHTADTPHYDATLVDEVRRVQASLTSPSPLEAINRKLNHTTNPGFPATSPPPSHGSEMTPYILSPPHGPIPMALVNRPPHGAPNNKSLHNPQNAVWLAALQHATRNVFIQSPTLNAEPLVPAIAAACERGVDVFCYISIGYNDAGELLPMQGGHNEMIAHNLYTSLSPAGRAHLHYYWYVGKDQTKPIIQAKKKRSCHIKLMIVDEHIGITGNGNQDTQSWFHSQEINVMIDSREICKAWIEGLRRNQNTHLYGELDKETGVWRDAEGREADGAMGVDPGRFSWAKGIVGAVKRVQGTGGF
jgi:phosphatidylserine/phosphatidylglycerophosphate/cardiolipin synthase-like enzyme